MTLSSAPAWRPDRFALRRPYLRARGAIVTAVRRYFGSAGFVEVETPALQVSPGLEPHLKACAVTLRRPDDSPVPLYLHTSPEFAMKKLLAAGEERIFQLARVVRDGERSPTHHPEFVMLEWYRAGGSVADLMADCEALLRAATDAAQAAGRGAGRLLWQGRDADPAAPFERIAVAEAMRRHARIDIAPSLADPAQPDRDRLAQAASASGMRIAASDDWDAIFFKAFLERVEPHLGHPRPTFLTDYPIHMAALSRPKPGALHLADRFELYAAGLELANAFGELTDPAEQRRRFEIDMDVKQRFYGTRYPIDEDFLAALEHGLPESAGIALGLDRLVMLATGAADIEDVLWLPVDARGPCRP